MWVRSHRVTRSQDQILRAAANNRVCGHASGAAMPRLPLHPQNVKQCYVLRDPHLRFGYYAVEIIITFCVKLLRFGLCSYVLGNVTFCSPTPVVGRRPHHAVSKSACLALSSVIIIVSLQYLSRSSLHRLAGLPCRLFLSYGLQVVTREAHRSSLMLLILICPARAGPFHFSHVYDLCPFSDDLVKYWSFCFCMRS